MSKIWLDGKCLFIEADTARDVRILEEAEKQGYIKKCGSVNRDGYDIIWYVGEG